MSRTLRVGGITPLTTLDYPGMLACVVFCQGCAWRCRYCHNPHLIPSRSSGELAWADVTGFLQARRGLLQAVVFSGGEPTQQPALIEAVSGVREMGFKVGMHSAGIKPRLFAHALQHLDWVGFDIKALPGRASHITGTDHGDKVNWQSLDLLLASGVAHEVRTTVHSRLLDTDALGLLAQNLHERGVQRFVVQLVRSGHMLDASLGPSLVPPGWPQLREQLGTLFQHFEVRGAC